MANRNFNGVQINQSVTIVEQSRHQAVWPLKRRPVTM